MRRGTNISPIPPKPILTDVLCPAVGPETARALGDWAYEMRRARAYNRGPGQPMTGTPDQDSIQWDIPMPRITRMGEVRNPVHPPVPASAHLANMHPLVPRETEGGDAA